MRDGRRRRFIIGLLIVISLTLILLDLRGDGGPLSTLRGVGGGVFGTIESAISGVTNPIAGFFGSIGSWGDQTERIANLEAEKAALESQLKTTAVDAKRLEELDGLLKIAAAGQYKTVPAQVIAVGPMQGFAWTVTIDAGSNDGIRDEMSVINAQGLVGRIISTTDTTATVLLIIDASSAVGARVAGSDEIGILAGNGRQESLEMQLLDPNAPIKMDDILVTFGSKGGKPYAPGIPIGIVTDVSGTPGQLTRIAIVKPYVDMSKLNIVGVVVEPPRTDPRDAVLPEPLPTQNPTPTADATSTSDASPGASPSAEPTPTLVPNQNDGASP